MATNKNCWTCGWNIKDTCAPNNGYTYYACNLQDGEDTHERISIWEEMTPFDGTMPESKNTLRRCPGWKS